LDFLNDQIKDGIAVNFDLQGRRLIRAAFFVCGAHNEREVMSDSVEKLG
jgi:hypothetical protein